MALRTINFSVDVDGKITPATEQKAGVQGEHNITEIVFAISDALQGAYPQGETVKYRVQVIDGAGGFHSSGFLDLSEGKITYPLPDDVTKPGGLAFAYLVITEITYESSIAHENQVFMSEPCKIRFTNSGVGSPSEYAYRKGITSALFDAQQAAKASEEAKEAARNSAASASDSAEAAETKANEAKEYANGENDYSAKHYANEADNFAFNAEYYMKVAKQYKDEAETSKILATSAGVEAQRNRDLAFGYANNALAYSNNAKESAENASASETNAGKSSFSASISASVADEKAVDAQKAQSAAETAQKKTEATYLEVEKSLGRVLNALKGSASGTAISVNDVSPIEHSVEVKLSSDNVTDFSGIEVSRYGKNLLSNNVFDFSKWEIESSNQKIFSFSNLIVGKTYTFSFNVFENLANSGYLYFNKRNGSTSTRIETFAGGSSITKSSVTFTVEEGYTYYLFGWFQYATSEMLVDNIFKTIGDFQLELGSSRTAYEPYIEPQIKTSIADGTVEGITSIAPNMTLLTNNDGVVINAEYNRDINTIGEGGNSVTILKVTESTADGGSNVVTFSDGTTLTVKNGSKGSTGTKGDKGDKGDTGATGAQGEKGDKGDTYALTEADKAEIAKLSNTVAIPDYWQEYLNQKISYINELQADGGKDCFSFVVMTDLHYPSNLGKNSPILAKEIADKCNIKFVLCLGDTQTRGCHSSKESLLAENEAIEEMLSPIRDRLLQTEGNHDGAYGNLNGNTYVYNLTPAELHSAIYRKVGMVGDVYFDESGSGYYIDDTANKVRYIVLNTQNNKYELQADGTVKYPKMWLFRFGQSQFDFLIEALNNIPTDSWNVVVAGHCPITQEIGDREIMQGVLNAYKKKTTYSGTYAGTAEGGADYNNLAEPLPENTTDTDKWVNGYRFSSSGISAQDGTTVSNLIPCKNGDIIRIMGVTLRENTDRIAVYGSTFTDFAGGYFNNGIPISTEIVVKYDGFSDGVYTFTVQTGISHTITGFRFAMSTPEDVNGVIVTVNEEIVESEHGYDYVNVNANFEDAKGELISYFSGHIHADAVNKDYGFNIISTRCDAAEENNEELKAERVEGTVTEQSFDVFTVDKSKGIIYATKIGAGDDREISF